MELDLLLIMLSFRTHLLIVSINTLLLMVSIICLIIYHYVCMYINLPINIMYVHDVRRFIPKWTTVNDGMLFDYKCTLDMSLENIVLPEVHCRNAQCTSQGSLIQKFHEIIAALIKVGKVYIPLTTPNSYYDKSQLGWSEHVTNFI